MCHQTSVELPCGCVRKWKLVACYPEYICKGARVEYTLLPFNPAEGCQIRCAYHPYATQKMESVFDIMARNWQRAEARLAEGKATGKVQQRLRATL